MNIRPEDVPLIEEDIKHHERRKADVEWVAILRAALAAYEEQVEETKRLEAQP